MTSIKVPPLGESIVEATVSRWMKKEGDQVAPGDTLVELETDKITVEVPAMSRGVLKKRLHAEGDVVKVDDVLGEIDESAAVAAVAPAGSGSGQASRGAAPSAVPEKAAAGTAASQGSAAPAQSTAGASPASKSSEAKKGEVRASPAAERLASQRNVDLSSVTGTGRSGVISKPDVVDHLRDGGEGGGAGRAGVVPAAAARAAASEGPTQPLSPAPVAPSSRPTLPDTRPLPSSTTPTAAGERETREKMSTRRKRIAEHLLESQHATAHLTTFNEIDMSVVETLRARIKERVEKEHGVRLSLMPFFVKAACMALKTYPIVNAQIDGDSIVYKHYVNMGIAVASDAGLVVPSIKDADRKGLLDLARDIAALAKKARDGKLTMDDLTGGTFTITNGGVFGSLLSTPILNYPQVGILGLHKTQDRPVAVDGAVQIRPMMYVALSYDHRVIDGQQAVLFLVRVKELMDDPATMLVE
jgi:2-oxoglutarate dehydrogenase E2 component (dihydrolipoamide succinyltransferase)